MHKYFSIASVLITSMIIMISSCSKEDIGGKNDSDNPSPDNVTNGKTTAVFSPGITYGTLTDQDGNVYKTVIIGTQTWMAENLRTTKYNDGTSIPNITNATEWENLTKGAYCNYGNKTTDTIAIATHGRLYNWYAVNTGKLAPKGWHVPTDDEWTTLTNYLGGEALAGDKLKERGSIHWESPTSGATNETGFTALPGGYRNFDGNYYNIDGDGHWWSSTEFSLFGPQAWYRSMFYDDKEVYRHFALKEGLSVRCVKN